MLLLERNILRWWPKSSFYREFQEQETFRGPEIEHRLLSMYEQGLMNSPHNPFWMLRVLSPPPHLFCWVCLSCTFCGCCIFFPSWVFCVTCRRLRELPHSLYLLKVIILTASHMCALFRDSGRVSILTYTIFNHTLSTWHLYLVFLGYKIKCVKTLQSKMLKVLSLILHAYILCVGGKPLIITMVEGYISD